MQIPYTFVQQFRQVKRRLAVVERLAGQRQESADRLRWTPLTNENLNSVTTSGWYIQPQNANTPGNNYPFNRAGWLQVVDASNLGNQGLMFQTYQEYGFSGGQLPRRAWRSWYNGSWSPWRIIGDDTGWVTCPLRTGFSYQPGFTLQVRRGGDGKVTARGGISGSASIDPSSSYVIGDLPDDRFYPPRPWYETGTGSGPTSNPNFIFNDGGVIELRTNAARGNYYLADGINWYKD